MEPQQPRVGITRCQAARLDGGAVIATFEDMAGQFYKVLLDVHAAHSLAKALHVASHVVADDLGNIVFKEWDG